MKYLIGKNIINVGLLNILLIGITGGVIGCSNPSTENIGFAEKWSDFGEDTIESKNVSRNMAEVIVYRTNQPNVTETVNVYLNSEYLASLMQYGYQHAEVCPLNQRISVAFTSRDPGYKKKLNDGQYYDLPTGQMSFFKITDDAYGKPKIIAVDESTAKADMVGLRKQKHTLSRISNQNCLSNVLKKYTFEAGALFEFDKSDYANILPQGRQQINDLISDINNYRQNISSIYVEGHTDQQGDASYNDLLSQRRAETVKHILVENGVPSELIKAEGKGETHPIVTECSTIYPQGSRALNRCNEPNRRVEITLYSSN